MLKTQIATCVLGVTFASISAQAGNLPEGATVTTLETFPSQTEGLTGDGDGNLYTGGRNMVTADCEVWRVSLSAPARTVVGYVPRPATGVACVTSGLAFDAAGLLYIGTNHFGGTVYRLRPDAGSPPTATIFATGVLGANGIAFDRDGNLWVSDGQTNMGRLWKVPPAGGPAVEQFRVQPLRNSVALVGSNLFPGGGIPVDGIGRQIRSFVPGTLSNTLVSGGDGIVANGIAFDQAGNLWIADTARAAIWKVELRRDGSIASPMGCDTTYAPNTLCLSNVYVAHPMLEGVDGIALDVAGNIWGTANGRQAIVVVNRDRGVHEVFRNPVNGSTGLRNAGDQSVGNAHVLEFPSSPFLVGNRFCTASFDGGASTRDNAPNEAGEISPTGAARGKISCIDQRLAAPGLALPVH